MVATKVSVLLAVFFVGFASMVCGGGDESVSRPSLGVAARREPPPTEPASADDHVRFQRLKAEALQLMIEAAQKEMEIGSFQTRISAATVQSLSSMKDAADEMVHVVSDLKDALRE